MSIALNPIPDHVERGRSAGLPTADRHLSAREFGRWRKTFKFATPDLAAHAEIIELELGVLPQLGPNFPLLRAEIKQNLADFAAAMASA